MKTLLKIAVIAALASSTAMASWWMQGNKVLTVDQYANGKAAITIEKTTGVAQKFMLTDGLAHKKELLALAMSAKAAGDAIAVEIEGMTLSGIQVK